MRFGRNPFRSEEFPQRPADLTVAVLVHIPFQSGYFKQSLDVFRVMLASLRAHTAAPYELLVLDNGSCAEVRQFLLDQHQAGVIQQLALLEENAAQLGAFNFLFGAARGKYIAYADYDFYFEPNWLPRHLEIVETFPNVGMVSGIPMRHRNHIYTQSTLEWARAAPGVRLEQGQLSDPAWMKDVCEEYGWPLHRMLEAEDKRLTHNGVSAFVGAYHGQFVIPKAAALKVLPLPTDKPLAADVLDKALDDAGCLRLATNGVYVHHMGNVLAPRWEAEARRLGVNIQPGLGQRLRPVPYLRYRAVHNRFVRPVVSWLHEWTFNLLTQKPH